MNIYVVVEGDKTEKLVYASWIPIINPQLSAALRLENVVHNNYFIEGGGGMPNYLEVIAGAVENVATLQQHGHQLFDRLVVAVDSEDMTLAEKHDEINNHVADVCALHGWAIDCKVIVQHFCFETWALGNRKLVRGNIASAQLQSYVKDYNVHKKDPESLPPRVEEELNRAQHAKKYLKLLLNEKFPKQGFSPSNPGPICHQSYFTQVRKRRDETGHIASFGAMLSAFV